MKISKEGKKKDFVLLLANIDKVVIMPGAGIQFSI